MNFLRINNTFANMFREVITEELLKRGISKRKCALDNGLVYQNFYHFLLGKRSMPVSDIEKVLSYLDILLHVRPTSDDDNPSLD